MYRLHETPWTPTERTKNGKYAVMRMSINALGEGRVKYYGKGNHFIFGDRETAQRMCDELNEEERRKADAESNMEE